VFLHLALDVRNEGFEICTRLGNTIFTCKWLSLERDSECRNVNTYSAFDLVFPEVVILQDVYLFFQINIKIVPNSWVLTLDRHCFKHIVWEHLILMALED
jgi:hypothetical protein